MKGVILIMKKLLTLFIVLCLCLTGCGSKQTVTSSFFIPSFDFSIKEPNVEYTPDTGTLKTTSDFMYSDLCYEPEDVYMDIDYDFAGTSLACFNATESKVIFSKNIYEKVYPASTTKLLTALTCLKYADLDTMVTIEEDNCGITTPGAQLCGFKAGDTLTVDQLLHCLMIYSGNDAGVAIAIAVSGSVEAFVKLMNEEAARIGCINTHFANPHGLQALDHYTTAYDMYLIFNECLKNKAMKDIVKCTSYTCVYRDMYGREQTLEMEATNLYFAGLKNPPENVTILGGKTGATVAAGYCLVIASENAKGETYITEVFKSQSYDTLYADMNQLLELINK